MSVDTKTGAAVESKPDEVTLTIDGIEVSVPKGSVIIRAAEKLGIAIPRFCDHPLLDPAGACRQCLVEVPDAGNGRGMPKPVASCTEEAKPGMVVKTQLSSEVARKAQEGMLELLLINHPLDCPICDKGGECPLQNQAMAEGPDESRFQTFAKRTYPKPVAISAEILLDRERCVLCQRCTRFSEQISGDPFIALVERGALQQIGSYETEPYDSYFAGNVVQICPVGALTSADYRFQARPFDLVSVEGSCEHCASGCSLRTDHRHFQVKRRLAGFNPEVNEEWNCDKGRFGFHYGRGADRLRTPLVREDGVLRPASWAEAIDVAVAGLRGARGQIGVQTGGRLSVENAYAYSKFARLVLGTNNIDFRSRPHTTEEAGFLAQHIAGRGMDVTYADLQAAKRVVLVGFEPEDESPIVFLRLRKAVRKNKLQVVTISALRSRGSAKLDATVIPTLPGAEADALRAAGVEWGADTILLVGERAALAPGALTAAGEIAATTGTRLAWIPRRAGERGALEAGCLPDLLPGGRQVNDAQARVDVAAAWGTSQSLPGEVGLDADAMFAEAQAGRVGALICAGLEPRDFRDPAAVRSGLEQAGFVIALEQRISEVTERANVVFPVALMEEQNGTFLDWEGRERFAPVVNRENTSPMTDLRVLAALADALGADLGIRTTAQAKAELAELGQWTGERPALANTVAEPWRAPADGQLTLATWRELIDASRGLDGAELTRATARPVVARVSPATAQRYGLGLEAEVGTATGSLVVPVEVVADMCDDVVWLPMNAMTLCVTEQLAAVAGDPVWIRPVGGVA